MEILGVSEVRWTTEKRKLHSGHTILYCGTSDYQHAGVALIISRWMKKTFLEWMPFGLRLLKTRFNSRYTKLTAVVCYALTEDTDEDLIISCDRGSEAAWHAADHWRPERQSWGLLTQGENEGWEAMAVIPSMTITMEHLCDLWKWEMTLTLKR